MTTYTDFAESMLIALYQESESDRAYPEGITLGALINRYGLPDNARWTDRLAKEWELEGLADVSSDLGPSFDHEVEISGRGMRVIEERYGGKDGVSAILEPARVVPANAILTEDGDPLVTEDGDFIVTEDAQPLAESTTTASENWTGLPRSGTLNAEAADRLKVALKVVDQTIAGASCSNEERAQARAYLIAIHALAEAPDPPADLIWKLIERANSIAGIAALFVSLMALFAHA